jgi:hypothetical protein
MIYANISLLVGYLHDRIAKVLNVFFIQASLSVTLAQTNNNQFSSVFRTSTIYISSSLQIHNNTISIHYETIVIIARMDSLS